MKLLSPKGAARAPTDSGFPELSLVTYENEGEMLLAAVLGFKKHKYVLLNERGREIELSANRLHAIPGRLPPQAVTIESRKEFLAGLSAQASATKSSIDVKELWTVVQDSPKEYSTRDLFELLHGTSPQESNANEYLSLRFALAGERIHFKREREGFIPRSGATVVELEKAETVRAQKLARRDVFVSWVKNRRRDVTTPLPEELAETIEILEEVAASAPHLDNSQHKEAKELVDLCVATLGESGLGGELFGNRELRATQLLKRIGWFTERTNLSLIRHRPPRRFSRDVLDAANAINIPSRLEAYQSEEHSCARTGTRADFTSWSTFSIDDVTTRDMDDAISFEQTIDGYRLGIHISDVGSMISPDSPVDKAALHRATSLYLPEQTIHMLPECLSEDKLSLKEGEVRPTLSCIIELNAQLSVLRTEIRPSLIKSRKRYTYDEFEALLEDAHSEHHKLYELTSILEENRIENGAQKVYKRDLLIDLADDGTLSLREIDEHGPARALVGELMIFANALLAQYAVTHRIPVVFRCQEPPEPLPEQTPRGDDIDGQPTNSATGPAADYAERSKMKKSSISVDPARHSGLGLDAYIQATSPIRRFIDLVNQRQILHHLRHGTPRYQRPEVEEIIFAAEQPLATANTINKETRRFWLLTYLVERMERARAEGRREDGMVISATVLRTDLRNPLVELDEIFMPTLVKFQRTPRVGDQVSLRIASIDPQRDYLRLEPIEPAS